MFLVPITALPLEINVFENIAYGFVGGLMIWAANRAFTYTIDSQNRIPSVTSY